MYMYMLLQYAHLYIYNDIGKNYILSLVLHVYLNGALPIYFSHLLFSVKFNFIMEMQMKCIYHISSYIANGTCHINIFE